MNNITVKTNLKQANITQLAKLAKNLKDDSIKVSITINGDDVIITSDTDSQRELMLFSHNIMKSRIEFEVMSTETQTPLIATMLTGFTDNPNTVRGIAKQATITLRVQFANLSLTNPARTLLSTDQPPKGISVNMMLTHANICINTNMLSSDNPELRVCLDWLSKLPLVANNMVNVCDSLEWRLVKLLLSNEEYNLGWNNLSALVVRLPQGVTPRVQKLTKIDHIGGDRYVAYGHRYYLASMVKAGDIIPV